MSDLDLAELRGLLERAVPLPWRCSESWHPPVSRLQSDEAKDANGNVFWGYSLSGSNEHGGHILPTLGAVHNFPDHIHANAALIVAAVNALPALLDRVEELERELWQCAGAVSYVLSTDLREHLSEPEVDDLIARHKAARAALEPQP